MKDKLNTYAVLSAFLGNRTERKTPAGTHTRIVRTTIDGYQNCIAVEYYWTQIVTFTAGGSVVLNAGNWRSATTKARMNEYAPDGVSVFQDKGDWFVCDNGKVKPFCNGMKVKGAK